MNIIKDQVKKDYEQWVKRKIMAAKKAAYRKWQQRHDFEAILSVQEW